MGKELRDVTISATIEPSLRDELAKNADKNGRSFSSEVRLALRLYVLSINGKKAA